MLETDLDYYFYIAISIIGGAIIAGLIWLAVNLEDEIKENKKHD